MPVAARLLALDRAGFRLLRTAGHTPALERAVRGYSTLGEHAAAWLALGAAGAALDARRRGDWRRATMAVAGAYAANQAIKLTVRRSRPDEDGLPPLAGTVTMLSFPSAHAASSVAAARAFGPLVPAPGALRLAAGAMAVSRLYLGVHWPSDVAAGAALGIAVGSLGR